MCREASCCVWEVPELLWSSGNQVNMLLLLLLLLLIRVKSYV